MPSRSFRNLTIALAISLQKAIAATEMAPTVRKEGVKFRVDAMLRTMEGVKQEAHFDEEIRNNKNEHLICQELMRMLTR